MNWNPAIYGAFAAGFLIVAVYFLRMWRTERQPLLITFAAAFALLALNYAILGVTPEGAAQESWAYLIRLGAFVMILLGIALTNLRGSSQ